jgi:hypothetical protein
MQFWRDTIGKSPAMVVFPPFFFPLGCGSGSSPLMGKKEDIQELNSIPEMYRIRIRTLEMVDFGA